MAIIINNKSYRPFLGGKEVEVWIGSKKIYPEAVISSNSYMILTDDTRIDFELDNTPIDNLSTTGNSTSSITINGQSVVKNTIKEVYFGESYNDITSIGDYFLRYFSSLTSVNLSGLNKVTNIGDNFLYNCTKLTSVDLSPLSNLTSIGNYFLTNCSGLTSVDLKPLSNVTSIGNSFLSYCFNLTSVDLKPLSNVTSIGNSFLSDCSKLTYVDLSPLSKVTNIGNFFLSGCSSLTYVDLSPLSKVTSIGNYFLRYCLSLTTLKMGAEIPPTLGSSAFSSTSNLSLIQVPCNSESAYKSATNWNAKADIIQGYGCPLYSYMILTDDTRIDFELANTPISNLSTTGNATSSITVNGQSVVKNTIKEIYFGESYKDVTDIGNNFLNWCSGLTEVDLSGLSNVTKIGYGVLYNCTSLTSVNLSDLVNVTSVGGNFLRNSSNLTEINLSGFSNVTDIGTGFLHSCTKLTSVDLSPLSNITTIKNWFLQNCTSLTSVNLSGLSNVTSIEDSFLNRCSSLTEVDLSPLSNITSIRSSFLYSCSSLTTLIMGAETPPTLGVSAFANANNLSLIQVPCESESAYKSATNWIAKESIIQGDCNGS